MPVPCNLIALLLCWALVACEPPGLYCQEQTPSSVNLTYSLTIGHDDYESPGEQQQAMASADGAFVLKFGTLPTQPNPHSLSIVHAASNTIVWYTYRPDTSPGQYDNLGGTSATLQLQQDGDLAITVSGAGGEVLVWHSATLGKGVRTMELRGNGNLALLNSSKGIVWQSFDHPVDTLLRGQRLLPGASLLGLATNKYPSVGSNVLTLEASRLVSYVVYVEAEPYWELKGAAGQKLAYAALVNRSLGVFDEKDTLVGSVGINTDPGDGVLQRLLLDIDGNMRLFEYSNLTSSWSKVMQVIEEACALPDDCGSYGQCVPGQGCACPPSFDLLATINGCVHPEGFDCGSRYGADFVKVPHASYFALPLLSLPSLGFDACKGLCTSNCSCLGFFYSAQNGSCFVTHQMRTFSSSVYNNYTEKYAYDLYVRVQGKPRSPLAIILGVCIPIAVIILGVLLWLFVRDRVKVAHAEEEEFLLEALPGLPPRYSYKELKNATNNFSQRLGAGSFGSVYEGVLPDGTKIAVKQLEGATQGKKEFHAEVATIGTVRHLNLVRLRGFCLQRNHRLLVYEHMAKGSLDSLLFRRDHKQRLSWHERLRVAVGVARALAYLHEGTPDCIIHCDIKPENVLVDEDGDAKLSDFGLAKLMSRQLAYVETIVRGTRGYMAPEWWRGKAQISEKADVYSYGVLLLEILSGRRNFDGPAESGKTYLPDWALSGGVEAVQEIADPSLVADPDTWQQERAEVERALLVALWCVQEDAEARPAMSRVARMLEGDADVAAPPLASQDDAFSSAPPSPMAFNMADRMASSEVALPFLRRASRFLFSSTSNSSATSARPSPLSSVY